jgi:hypothetical protein
MGVKKGRTASSEHRRIRRQRILLSVIGVLVIAAYLLSLVR